MGVGQRTIPAVSGLPGLQFLAAPQSIQIKN